MKEVVMLLTNAFDPDVRVYKEAVYLLSKGFRVTILCWDREADTNRPEQDNVDGIAVIRFRVPSVAGSGKKQIPAFFRYIRLCKRWLKSHHADFYHANDIDGAITWLFAKNGNAPMIFDMHEYYEDYGTHTDLVKVAYRTLTKFFIKKSRYSFYENMLYLKPPYKSVWDKLLILKNFPDSDLVRYEDKQEDPAFLRIGYHGCVRGQMREFTTLFEAVKDMPDVRVDIHGGGPDLPKLKAVEPDYPNVHIHGPFNGAKELTSLYSQSDIVFAGYRKESESCEGDEMVKFFECIVTGTPVILTEVYSLMARQVNDGGFGIACDTDDVEQVREAVLRFKNDRAYLHQCRENELNHAKEYDWKEAVKILDKAYC